MAAGAVSLVLVAGGFHVLWEDYQRGNLFKPELFVKTGNCRVTRSCSRRKKYTAKWK